MQGTKSQNARAAPGANLEEKKLDRQQDCTQGVIATDWSVEPLLLLSHNSWCNSGARLDSCWAVMGKSHFSDGFRLMCLIAMTFHSTIMRRAPLTRHCEVFRISS